MRRINFLEEWWADPARRFVYSEADYFVRVLLSGPIEFPPSLTIVGSWITFLVGDRLDEWAKLIEKRSRGLYIDSRRNVKSVAPPPESNRFPANFLRQSSTAIILSYSAISSVMGLLAGPTWLIPWYSWAYAISNSFHIACKRCRYLRGWLYNAVLIITF